MPDTDPGAEGAEAPELDVVAEATQPVELGQSAPAAEQVEADPTLLAAVDLARDALLEIAPEHAVGEPAGYRVEDERTVSLRFESRLRGYPGWHWTVTLTRVDAETAPTVLEAELMPGEDALLAPDWVPWSERLADYRAAQEAHRAESEDADEAGAPRDGGVRRNRSAHDQDEDDRGDDAGATRAAGEDAEDDELEDDELDDDLDDEDDLDDDDDDDEDDDLDDDLDGVDFDAALEADELVALDRDVDDSDDSEGEADDGDPEPPSGSHGSEGAPED